ncbi:interferon-related developmental regulator-domain-containing protein [Corynascus novoguineensis]|uniref:Interferon-related developmental regulator-domain-containing protein n=1 Tax=Corynascus novoguineensis TaxID=1126955 RepID=A0AAN7HIU3_9PEZI|nr:interferon-related developmental regulator-domain-containing protein [Corynascus novoguineensis]
MSELRRRALTSGKTVSRKARAKPESGLSSTNHSPNGSPGNSRAGSRANSRPGSRYASEDEFASDSDNDDIMTMSTNSVDEEDDVGNMWAERLQDRITELQDRKRSSVQGREATLGGYNHLLKHHFAQRQLDRYAVELIPVLLRDIKSGSSDEERLRALKAFTLTVLTCSSETVFEQALPILKAACYDAEEVENKVEAIHALCIAVTYGGGSMEAAEEVLDFLLEIIESDGQSVGATDNGPVVTAALQAWAFVASHLDDLTTQSETAIEAFIEQLDSSDTDVQTSAGVNIALVFESARDYEEETGESVDMQYNQHRIMTRMAEIVRGSSKSVSKKGRRNLRANFSSIVTSLERGKGPGYSTAGRSGPNPHTGGSRTDEQGDFREFGYREKIRIYNQFLLIDTWSLHARAEMLKTLLGGGFGIHYLENPVVRDILSDAEVEFISNNRPRK